MARPFALMRRCASLRAATATFAHATKHPLVSDCKDDLSDRSSAISALLCACATLCNDAWAD
eukprot:CAMPEP_0201225044 /NCGR_PEP_ID=MMETSP0851-20130426/193920_1 /ASSEMBLY_ACC=CAM_ASM_000631 /TAXON_ID=183588 /ORGANISM="Pseudo-nitzschia fraudulenta, Strain WWA7" /LENGTH=61 /DNA_ID=CAMNT_0047514813 /DNA_START=158 /DNA_END=343 /DNA_ORIENTATION=-